MANRLYVGNLNYSVSTDELVSLFSGIGTVIDAKVLTDRETGRSRGFGFVTMSSESEAAEAIRSYNGFLLSGRVLVVNEAVDKRSNGDRPYTPRVNTGPMPVLVSESIPTDENNKKRHTGRRRRRNRDDDNDFGTD
jgi:RNA recognition motif-containing protein